MIIKIGKAGASFKGLGNYLTEQKERVAWTHSLNCAHEDGPSVIHEMYTTFMDAEFLKEQTGQHGGGTRLENPVKHISLSWRPDQHPTKEQMIETAQSFLTEMGWEEHQALLVAHNEKEHPHVHIMANRVHPETGLGMNERYERERARHWGLAYELEQGEVLCKQRLLDREDRTPSPSRSTWERLKEFEKEWIREEQQRPYDPSYLAREERREVTNDHEWELLKERQKKEREDFFHVEGKRAFKELRNEIIRDIRDDMRGDWKIYYEEKRAGADPEYLAEKRADLVELQQQRIDMRINRYGGELREQRDAQYKELLLRQKEERQELAERQEQGFASPHLLERQSREPILDLTNEAPRDEEKQPGLTEEFKAAAAEVTGQDESGILEMPAPETPAEDPRVKGPAEGIGGLGLGALGGLSVIVERLFDGFFGHSPPANQNGAPKPEPKPETRSKSDAAREQAVARAVDAAIRAAEADREERQRDQEYWQERERSRGYRD